MSKKPKKKITNLPPSQPGRKKSSLSPMSEATVMSSFFGHTRLQGALIFAFAFLLYANTLGHQWAQDDTVVLTDNMFTQAGISGIPDIFSRDTFFGYFKIEGKASVVSGGRYRPLTLALFAIVFQFFGKNPFPFHLLTVLLFAFTCLVLYKTLLLLLRDYASSGYVQLAAWIATLLFAAHPVHTEVVANVKGCDEIVALLCSLGALYFSLRTIDSKNMKYGLLAAFLLWLGLLAKETTVTFLGVIPLALIIFRRATFDQLIKVGVPMIIAFGAFFMMRLAVLPEVFSKPPLELINNPYVKWEDGHWVNFTPAEKYATIFYTLGQYVRLLFFPLTLTHDYYPRHIGIMHWSDPLVPISLMAYLFLFGYVVYGLWTGKRDLLRFGILYFLITLSIVSNLVFPIGTNMGERFLFMPSIGFCLVAAVLLLKLAGSNGEWKVSKIGVPVGALALIAVFFSIRTITRNPVWHDNKSLAFTDVLTSVNSTKVLSFCGGLYCEDGLNETDPVKKDSLFQKSVEYNSRAIAIHPTHKSALLNRGVSYTYLKQYDAAIADLRKVRQIAFDDHKGVINLSVALCGKGKYFEEEVQNLDSAFALLQEAIQTDETNEEAIWHMGVVEAKRGRYAQAIPWFVMFTEIRPKDPAAWEGLKWAYQLIGDQPNADRCSGIIENLKAEKQQ